MIFNALSKWKNGGHSGPLISPRIIRVRNGLPPTATTGSRSLLSVPVEIRGSSNSLPAHAQISLQTAIRDFAPGASAMTCWRMILRNLELAQFRLAAAVRRAGCRYRDTLADFLGENFNKSPRFRPSTRVAVRHAARHGPGYPGKLDALDHAAATCAREL